MTPKLTGEEIVEAVPELSGVASVSAASFRQVPGSDLTMDDVVALSGRIKHRLDGGAAGVVTRGTDSIEETTGSSSTCSWIGTSPWSTPEPCITRPSPAPAGRRTCYLPCVWWRADLRAASGRWCSTTRSTPPATWGGVVLKQTYGFPGSETDLLARDLLSAGPLPALKARLLLSLLLRFGSSKDEAAETFEHWMA